MTNLIFLYNELLDRQKRDRLRIPIVFIDYAFVQGKLYNVKGKPTAIEYSQIKRNYGNDRIYGAIFSLDEPHFYIRQLDAFYGCSLSRLNTNHKLDYMHRKLVIGSTIGFDTLEQFAVLKYKPISRLKCWVYFGNPEHQQIATQIKRGRSRILEGVDVKSFKICYEQFRNEVRY